MVAMGIGLGVLWGGIFGFAAHLATRGERGFSSLRGLSAAHYDLVAREGGAEAGRGILSMFRYLRWRRIMPMMRFSRRDSGLLA